MRFALRAFSLLMVVVAAVAAVIVFSDPGEQTAEPPHVSLGVPDLDGYGDAVAAGEFIEAVEVNAYLDALHQAELAAQPRVSRGGGSCDRPVDYGRDDGSYSIPTEIVMRESGGNYGSCNESSGACGAYQVLGSTWAGYGGYASACDAPPAVQDQWAAEAWAQAGCRPWGGC